MEYLIDPHTKWWDQEKIRRLRRLFRPQVAVEILKTGLGTTNHVDKLIWGEAKDVKYSVKSAYIFFKDKGQRDNVGESSTKVRHRGVWKAIWTICVPHCVKIFAWRACKESLPTRNNLKHRKVVTNHLCQFYKKNLRMPLMP